MFVEYKVRPVTRYIVTVFTSKTTDHGTCKVSSTQMGMFDNLNDANFVASKLADSERNRLEGSLEGYKVVFTPLSVPGEFSQFE